MIADLPILHSSTSTSASMECSSFRYPILLNHQILNEQSLEDKLCELIVSHKRNYNLTEVGAIKISENLGRLSLFFP